MEVQQELSKLSKLNCIVKNKHQMYLILALDYGLYLPDFNNSKAITKKYLK